MLTIQRFGALPQTPEPKPSSTGRVAKGIGLLGTATLVTGLAMGIGGAVNANIKHDGKFNIVASSAEEAYAQKKAAIPGMMVLLAGTLLRGVSRNIKRLS